MTDKTTSALKLAEKTLRDIIRVYKFETGTPVTALAAIREALAEQEKQEPVYAFRRRGLNDFCTCTKERYEELAGMPNLFEVTTFYAAPVQPVKQEPVEWHVENVYERGDKYFAWIGDGYVQIFTAPVSAKREWVELTDDEIDLIEQQVYCRTTQKGRPLGVYAVELVRAVITAFKEKNK